MNELASPFTRNISAFDKSTGAFVESFDIDIPLQELQRIIVPYSNDPYMIMQYDVDLRISEFLRSYTDRLFYFDLYDYEMGAYAS